MRRFSGEETEIVSKDHQLLCIMSATENLVFQDRASRKSVYRLARSDMKISFILDALCQRGSQRRCSILRASLDSFFTPEHKDGVWEI